MKAIIGHIGAWAPRAEQIATAKFLENDQAISNYLKELKQKIDVRFNGLYKGFEALKAKGFPVQIIAPEGAIYLTAQFALIGKKLSDGTTITTTADISSFLLNHAQLALVPFTAFGCPNGTDWYRISVGTLNEKDIPALLLKLENALSELQ